MTTTQIASMKPIDKAASIFNSSVPESFCARLGLVYDSPGERTIPIEPIWGGQSPQCRSGEERILRK
jgi:hypothetical protein